jgi:proteasome assembly chaperone (PAC2) family protein
VIEEQPYRVYRPPQPQNPSLIVAWSQDAGQLGPRVVDFLNKKLGAQDSGEIEPWPFFHLGGVSIGDNVLQFPESKFYWCQDKDLLIFKSGAPDREHYQFLSTIIDIAQNYYRVKELYTIGGIVSATSHINPNRIFAAVNQPELKNTLQAYGIETGLNYHTPHGGRPTLSSFLLWVAKQREVAGVNLWGEVPFYLAAASDPRADKQMLTVLDKRFDLGMDLGELDAEVKEQNEKIEELRRQNAAVSKFIEMLERGIMISEAESEQLAREVTEFLEK